MCDKHVEVVLADDDWSNSCEVKTLCLVERRFIVGGFGHVAHTFDNEQTKIPELVLLEVEVADNIGSEVIASHIVEHLVRHNCVGIICEHHHMRHRIVQSKFCGFVGCGESGVVGETLAPNHSSKVRRCLLQFASLAKALQICRGEVGHVGVGIFFEHRFKCLLEFLGVAFGDVRQGVDEHKFRH